jgi:protein-disulfide isomerase
MYRGRHTPVFLILFLVPGLWASGAEQETGQDLKKEIEALKQGQERIQKELQEIKALLQGARAERPAPTVRDVVFSLGDHPVRGENTAPLTLVEFTDYQ